MSFNRKIYNNLLKRKNLIIKENNDYENENCFVVSKKFTENIDYYEENPFNSDIFESEKELKNKNYFVEFKDEFEKYNYYLKENWAMNEHYILIDSRLGMPLYKIFENNTKYILEKRVIKNNESIRVNLYNEDLIVFNLYTINNTNQLIGSGQKIKFKIDINSTFYKLDSLIDQIISNKFKNKISRIKFISIKSNVNSPPNKNDMNKYDLDNFKHKIMKECLNLEQEYIFITLLTYGSYFNDNYEHYFNSNNFMDENNFNINNFNQYDKLELPKGCVGLENLGNTCYMNSAIQALSHSPYFKEYLLNEKFKNDINLDNPLGHKGEFVKNTYKIFEKIWNSDKASYKPYKYKSYISNCNVMFEGNEQHDSSEFLGYIIDNLHEDTNLIKKKPVTDKIEAYDLNINDFYYGKISWINHLKRNHSFLNSLFYGQYKSIIKCPDCKKISITYDPFQMLHLPVMKNIKKKLKIFVINDKIIRLEFKLEGDPNKINNYKLSEIKNFILSKLNLEPNEYYSINYENAEKLNEEKMCFYEINFQNISLSFNKKDENFIDINEENENSEENKNIISIQLDFFNKLSFNYQFDENSKLKDLYNKVLNQILVEFKGKDLIGESLDEENIFYFNCYNEYHIENFDIPLKNFFNYKSDYFNDYNKRKKADTINSINLKNSLEISIHTKRTSENNRIYRLVVTNYESKKMSLEFERNDLKEKEKNNLYTLLKKFSLPEDLDENNTWYCSDCDKHKKATKILNIFKLPQILLIVLKKIKDFSSSDKENEVDFPFNLDMNDFVFKENNEEPIKDYEIEKKDFTENDEINEESLDLIPKIYSTKYELYAVINHIGTNAYGHYYSYIKIDNIWYEFNDSTVSEIKENKIVTSAALVLLYNKI